MGKLYSTDDKRVKEALDRYGLDRLLEDNDLTVEDAVDILVQLGYINLEDDE